MSTFRRSRRAATLPTSRIPFEVMQRKFLSLLLVSVFLGGAVTASGQSAKKTDSASGRSSAWTGVVTYTRTQSQTDSKTVERVSGRGKDTRNWEMKYDYKATVGVIEDPNKADSSIA